MNNAIRFEDTVSRSRSKHEGESSAEVCETRFHFQASYMCPYEMATAHAILGNKDKALNWLSRGLKERSACMAELKADPRLDSLRSDARFEDFLRRVGFQE
jgi:hypothetical protein